MGKEEGVKRTVTFSLAKNVDEFFTAYAKLLRYESVEDFLRQEIEWHFGNPEDRFDMYFDSDTQDKIMKRYGLIKEKDEHARK